MVREKNTNGKTCEGKRRIGFTIFEILFHGLFGLEERMDVAGISIDETGII